MNEEQQALERQDRLVEQRCKLIEAGQIKSGQPLPGDPPLVLSRRPENECPNCARAMTWHPARRCFICVHCNTPKT